MKTSHLFPGDLTNELVRHFLIETSSRGVKLKGCPNEPNFGKCPQCASHTQGWVGRALPLPDCQRRTVGSLGEPVTASCPCVTESCGYLEPQFMHTHENTQMCLYAWVHTCVHTHVGQMMLLGRVEGRGSPCFIYPMGNLCS